MDEKPVSSPNLEPIPGDTYPLRAELKALGAVWDPSQRVWRIAAEKLALATALVANQALVPPPALPTDDSGELLDPFEQDMTPNLVPLEKRDGATYEARDTLRAVGARWDKNRRSWMIREEKAEYARAVLASAAGAGASTAPTSSPPAADDEREPEARPVKRPVPAPDPPRPAAPLREATYPPEVGHITLGGLRRGTTPDGREYLQGNLSPTVRILIFPNDAKTDDSQPSHLMYLAPVEPNYSTGQSAAAIPAAGVVAGETDTPPPSRPRGRPSPPAPETSDGDDLRDPFED